MIKRYHFMNCARLWMALLGAVLFVNHAFAQYNEKYRPQFHLSSKASSMADPKGLFIYEGKYHIFWYGQWEHAVSTDLLHWNELPKPMKGAPSQFSYFSGSVVVDTNNTGGFGQNSIIAVYTRHFPGDSLPETQSISVSKDGTSFYYYDQNPVLDIGKKYFRDPQVFWYEPDKKWKMVVALPDQHQMPIYESDDLRKWTFCSSFGNMGARNSFWECPDLFELPISGTKKKKWVMIIGRGPNKVQYFIGDFNGKTFTPDTTIANYLMKGKGIEGKVYEDFEGNYRANWLVKGEAYTAKPETKIVSDYLGNGYAGNLLDGTVMGTMRSHFFRIERNAINFLVAGGRNTDSLCIRLVVDGKVMRTATGDNTKVFRWNGWDVHELVGKKAYIEIIDSVSGKNNAGFAIDHILFADHLLNLKVEHALWMDYGDDFYATRTYRNYDRYKKMGDSVILLSWLGNWKYARTTPTSWGTGFQSIPRNVVLKQFREGIRLVQEPMEALKRLRKDSLILSNRVINGVQELPSLKQFSNTYEMEVTFDTRTQASFGLNLLVGEGRNLALCYNPKTAEFSIDRTNCTDLNIDVDFASKFSSRMMAPVEPENDQLLLHIFVDKSSVEVFTNQGKIVLSTATFPSEAQSGVQLFSNNGKVKMVSCKAWRLMSVWNR